MTDLSRGYAHSALHPNSTGSVLPDPLFNFGEASIWLEHVVDRHSGERCFWLMWYDAEGNPTIPMSGVFGVDEIEQASTALRNLVTSGVVTRLRRAVEACSISSTPNTPLIGMVGLPSASYHMSQKQRSPECRSTTCSSQIDASPKLNKGSGRT